jgi:hypothetical protein
MSQRLQHMVIPCKIAHSYRIKAGIALFKPMTGSEHAADLQQRRFVDRSLPEVLESNFELTPLANSGIAQHMINWHGKTPKFNFD